MTSTQKHKKIRVYLRPGNIVTGLVDLIVTKEKNTDIFSYELHRYDPSSEIKFFSDEVKNDERDYGYLIKYAWDLDKDDKNYGKPYYEEKKEN